MTATQFTLNQLGVTFSVKLFDCESDSEFSTANIDTVSIVFTKSDGTQFSKNGALVEDGSNPGTFFIEYRNLPPEESILDLLKNWTYQGAGVLIDGSNFKTSERKIILGSKINGYCRSR